MENKKLLITLSILLILALGYIGYTELAKYENEENLEIYQYGYLQGNNDTMNYILSIVTQCEPLPLDLENDQTINLIAYECLQEEK